MFSFWNKCFPREIILLVQFLPKSISVMLLFVLHEFSQSLFNDRHGLLLARLLGT